MKKIIKLKSRDNLGNYLKFVDIKNNLLRYTLRTNYPYRLIYDDLSENKKIVAIDPSGGPMMYIGEVLDNMELNSIYIIKNNAFLTFKLIA